MQVFEGDRKTLPDRAAVKGQGVAFDEDIGVFNQHGGLEMLVAAGVPCSHQYWEAVAAKLRPLRPSKVAAAAEPGGKPKPERNKSRQPATEDK